MIDGKSRAYCAAISGLFFLIPLLAGCGSKIDRNGARTPSGKDADIRGQITDIFIMESEEGGGMLGSILIEGSLEEDTEFDRASVTLMADTRIYEQLGEEVVEAAFSDLQVGQRVQAVFTGPVAESYPVQATAAEILILAASTSGSPASETPDAAQVKAEHEAELMAIQGVLGLGIGGSEDEPAIVVYLIDNNPQLLAQIPQELDGIKVIVEVTGPIDIQP